MLVPSIRKTRRLCTPSITAYIRELKQLRRRGYRQRSRESGSTNVTLLVQKSRNRLKLTCPRMSTHTNTTLFFSRITLTLGTVYNDRSNKRRPQRVWIWSVLAIFPRWFKNRLACVRLSVSADERRKWESSEKASGQKMARREKRMRLVLQFPLSSPTPRGFRATFLDPLFLLQGSHSFWMQIQDFFQSFIQNIVSFPDSRLSNRQSIETLKTQEQSFFHDELQTYG